MASGIKERVQLVELCEKAVKASGRLEVEENNEAEETRCVDALKAMSSIPVTTALLMDTQVGKRLRRLTKHKSPKVSAVAQEIIDAWKKIVAAEASAKNGTPTSSSKSSVTTKDSMKSPSLRTRESPTSSIRSEKVTTTTTTTTTKVKEEAIVKMETKPVVSLTRTAPASNGSTVNLAKLPKSGDSTRDRIRELLAEAFSKVLSEAQDEDLQKAKDQNILHVAVTVECAMFKKLGLSKDANKTKYRSIMFNLKDGNNPDLRRRVLLGEIEPEELMTMSVDDMASDQRKAENNKIKQKALFECERGLKAAASTDQFKCGKCKKRQCTYFQMQTRSADEPMTTFVTCVNCNNHWKFC